MTIGPKNPMDGGYIPPSQEPNQSEGSDTPSQAETNAYNQLAGYFNDVMSNPLMSFILTGTPSTISVFNAQGDAEFLKLGIEAILQYIGGPPEKEALNNWDLIAQGYLYKVNPIAAGAYSDAFNAFSASEVQTQLKDNLNQIIDAVGKLPQDGTITRSSFSAGDSFADNLIGLKSTNPPILDLNSGQPFAEILGTGMFPDQSKALARNLSAELSSSDFSSEQQLSMIKEILLLMNSTPQSSMMKKYVNNLSSFISKAQGGTTIDKLAGLIATSLSYIVEVDEGGPNAPPFNPKGDIANAAVTDSTFDNATFYGDSSDPANPPELSPLTQLFSLFIIQGGANKNFASLEATAKDFAVIEEGNPMPNNGDNPLSPAVQSALNDIANQTG